MLEEFLDANKEFLKNQSEQEHSHGNLKRRLAVVTCAGSHLSNYIDKAFGLDRDEIFLIQNAGNTITSYDNSIIRSLAAAIYLHGIKEVAVVGHVNCIMRVDVSKLIDAMSKYGKTREVLKDADLREWFGIITNEEINIRKVVDSIKQSPIIPSEIPVYGLMVDDSGKLTEVYHYQAAIQSGTPNVYEKTMHVTYEMKPDLKPPAMKSADVPYYHDVKEVKPAPPQKPAASPQRPSAFDVKPAPPVAPPSGGQVKKGSPDAKNDPFEKFKKKMME